MSRSEGGGGAIVNMRAVSGCAFLLVLASGFAPAQSIAPAFAVVDEAARRIEDRCVYQVTAGEVYEGVLEAAHKRSGDDKAGPFGLAALQSTQAAAAFRPKFQALAERAGQRLDAVDLAEAGLSDYCRTIDLWSHYITAQDTARIEQFQTAESVGIGVNLRDEKGTIYCHPFPDSQAGLAGITSGDKLISVDGRPVAGRPLELVAAWIKGVPGTQTKLRVEKPTGRALLVTALREAVKMPSVIIDKDPTGTLVKIRSFENDTAKQIVAALKDQPPGRRLTLDLRGCGGGWMHSAVEVARLIVPPGKRLLSQMESGTPRQDYMSEDPVLKPGSIAILQDEGTGSAAEILIAALVENMPKLAVSRGERTHGKGVVQEVIKLAGGGRLVLTTGAVYGPSGRSWDGVGLLPSFGESGAVDIFPPNARVLPAARSGQ